MKQVTAGLLSDPLPILLNLGGPIAPRPLQSSVKTIAVPFSSTGPWVMIP